MTRLPFLGVKNKNKAMFAGNFVNQFDVTNHVMLFCNLNIASAYKSLGSSFKAVYGLTLGTYMTFFKDRRLTLIISGNDLFRKSLPNNSTYIYNLLVRSRLTVGMLLYHCDTISIISKCLSRKTILTMKKRVE